MELTIRKTQTKEENLCMKNKLSNEEVYKHTNGRAFVRYGMDGEAHHNDGNPKQLLFEIINNIYTLFQGSILENGLSDVINIIELDINGIECRLTFHYLNNRVLDLDFNMRSGNGNSLIWITIALTLFYKAELAEGIESLLNEEKRKKEEI